MSDSPAMSDRKPLPVPTSTNWQFRGVVLHVPVTAECLVGWANPEPDKRDYHFSCHLRRTVRPGSMFRPGLG